MAKSHSSICEAVLNTFDEAAVIWDRTGRVQLANKTALLQFGYSFTEFTLLSFNQLHAGIEQDSFAQILQAASNEGPVVRLLEVRFNDNSIHLFTVKVLELNGIIRPE